MDNTSISYMEQMGTRGMLNHGATIIQTEGKVGGTRYVFAGLEALIKNAFVHPPIGGNPRVNSYEHNRLLGGCVSNFCDFTFAFYHNQLI